MEGWRSKHKFTKANFIHDVQVTNDCLTSRAGHNSFVTYISSEMTLLSAPSGATTLVNLLVNLGLTAMLESTV